MANIHDLKDSVTELSDEEATKLILNIRDERREALNKKKSKRKKKKSSSGGSKKKSPKQLIADLSPEEAEELLKMLGGTSDDE